ncbi:DUF4832 domain-containing protein [Lachnospiraceae bacterium ZAX-1]
MDEMKKIMICVVGAILVAAVCILLVLYKGKKLKYTNFSEDKTVFVNPERGWHIIKNTAEQFSAESLLSYRENEKIGLILLETNLGDYRFGPLDDNKLREIKGAFDVIRKANDGVIFRAAYDYDGMANPEPQELDIVLGHIGQLSDLFYENEDILYCIQAGFLGPWGEWHDSLYGEPINVVTQNLVVQALLDAAPKSVAIELRRPVFVRTINEEQTLTKKEAFSGSALSRVAYHNDAVLSSESDMGTYSDEYYTRAQELTWTNNHTRYTPLVGEANQFSEYCLAKTAVPLLAQMNFQSLNAQFSPEVLDSWKGETYHEMNAYDYIGMNLGYRFVLDKVGFNKKITQGGHLDLELQLKNTGFGNLMKEKNLKLVLSKGSQKIQTAIDDDARWWDDEAGMLIKRYKFSIPKTMQPGKWDVFLSLSSTFDSLSDNPLYSIRFANEGVWDAQNGLNKIGAITIKESNSSSGFTTFEQMLLSD